MISAAKPEPWQCPQCKTWMRADVTEHRCPPGESGVPAMQIVGPGGGGGGSSATSLPSGWTVTTNAPALYATGGPG